LFTGTYLHNLDAKNRVTIPRKILEQADAPDGSKKYYISKGMEECLFFFTEERWNELAQIFKSLSLGKSKARKFQRLFFSTTYDVDLDNSGRILIPDALKKAAGLRREVVFIGAGNQVEIWDAEMWQAHMGEITDDFSGIAEDIFS